MIVVRVRTIPSSYRVSSKNGWKSDLLRKVNCVNPNWLQLKQLIPIEHNLTDTLIIFDSDKYDCFEYLLLLKLIVKYLLSYFFWLNTLKGTAKASALDLL